VSGALHLDDFAGQLVTPTRHGGVVVEQLVLGLVDVVLGTHHHRGLLVDDAR
jgi:hypothetical protein